MISKHDVEQFILNELNTRGFITLRGIGRLEKRNRGARTAINPQTRVPVAIPARVVLGVRTSPLFIEKNSGG